MIPGRFQDRGFNNLILELIQEVTSMRMKWNVLIAKVTVWMLLELLLNLLNLDLMADYSEFLFHPRSTSWTSIVSA